MYGQRPKEMALMIEGGDGVARKKSFLLWGSRETRGNPRLWVRIPALAGSIHDWGETLEQGPEPPTAPRAPHSRLPTAPSVCVCTWMG